MSQEVLNILREFYQRLLRDYHGWPIETAVSNLILDIEMEGLEKEVIEAHQHLNPNSICVAKAMVEKLT